MSKESDRTKITQIRNEKNNCGVCVCLLDKAKDDTPEDDIISLCIGECDEHGLPKHQILLNLKEANQIGTALVSAPYIKELVKREVRQSE